MQILHLWCVKQYIVILLAMGRYKQAQQFVQQVYYEIAKHLNLISQNISKWVEQCCLNVFSLIFVTVGGVAIRVGFHSAEFICCVSTGLQDDEESCGTR